MRSIIALGLLTSLLSGCVQGTQYRADPLQELRNNSQAAMKALAHATHRARETTSDDEIISLAQKRVADAMKDPASAQFRNVSLRLYWGGSVVCGEVNGKNSYGAYAGFQRFAAGPTAAIFETTGSRYPEVDQAANSALYFACR